MSRPETDVTFALAVLLLAVLALVFGGWLIAEPPIPLGRDILAMSPRVFPSLILAGTVIVSLSFLISRKRQGSFWQTPGSRLSSTRGAMIRQTLFVVVTVACALVLTRLGFLTTMFILMASTALLVGNRSPLQIVTISLVLPLFFYVAVTHVLRTELPEADIVERTLAPILQLLPSV